MDEPQNTRALSLPMDAGYQWSVGEHMERFYEGLKERRFLGARCPSCQRVYVPPRMICEGCFQKTTEWREVGSEGVVLACSIAHVCVDTRVGGLADLEEPLAIALIRLDGADSALVHRVGGTAPTQVAPGTRVRAVWAGETTGDLSDLKCFEPAG